MKRLATLAALVAALVGGGAHAQPQTLSPAPSAGKGDVWIYIMDRFGFQDACAPDSIKAADRLPDGTLWVICGDGQTFRIFRLGTDRKVYTVRCTSALPALTCAPWSNR